MKELSIEKKAKAYDEAIERAKSKIKNDKDHVLYEEDIIDIFPELKESEDERIRKELINFCKIATTGQSSILIEDANQFNRWAAWLEKQGEQILANSAKTCKDEPKQEWKPTEEQIRVIERLRTCLLEDVRGNDIVILDNLLEQLRALL